MYPCILSSASRVRKEITGAELYTVTSTFLEETESAKCYEVSESVSGHGVTSVMLKAMVAGGQQQLLEPHHHHQYTNNDTMYYDYYQPQQEYQHYPGQGSPELCPAHTTQLCTLHGDYGKTCYVNK